MRPDPEDPEKLIRCIPYKPDPDRPGKIKWDPDSEYYKFPKRELEKRIEVMIQIMKSRDIIYDPEPRLKRQMEERTRKHKEISERIKADSEAVISDILKNKG